MCMNENCVLTHLKMFKFNFNLHLKKVTRFCMLYCILTDYPAYSTFLPGCLLPIILWQFQHFLNSKAHITTLNRMNHLIVSVDAKQAILKPQNFSRPIIWHLVEKGS